MSESMKCRYCGRTVEWRQSKAGKNYLAEPMPIYNEDGRQIKTISPAHQCRVSEEERAEMDAQAKRDRDAAIERGEMVIGQMVEVAKGRKFPIGTIGKITWIADQPDHFDVIKARVEKADGERFFINVANLKVAQEVK